MPPKFVPRQRKQKNKQKERTTVQTDTNAVELPTVPKGEKEARKNNLREELRGQHTKVSAKKQKRLDKYIENKLKKEENLELLKKLAQSKVDTSGLKSSRDLGKGRKQDSKTERTARSTTADATNEAVSNSDLSDDEIDDGDRKLDTVSSENKSTGASAKPSEQVAVGSGLKRPLELGSDGFPVIKKRKRAPKAEPVVEIPWEGFDSQGEEEEGSQDEESAGSDDNEKDSASDEGIEDSSEGSSDDDENGKDSEEDSSDEDDDEEELSDDGQQQPRRSAFKDWAVQQINETVGFKPTTAPVASEQPFVPSKLPPRNTVDEEDPLPPELEVTEGNPDRKAFSVQINRSEETQNARLGLPVVGEEQKIMEAIHNNPSVVIWGATGSGKTTQLPQFLFEAGYGSPDSPNPGMIGVTQPRRVAAVSMAKRVGDELGQFSDRVSYQIRFESSASNKTAIKFMTDGILLREIADDFSLNKYSVIVIDEAHERSVNTDILIGMISRIVELRKAMSKEDPSVKPLKLVVMSATLRISDFTHNASLFRQGPPPLVQAEGRQYPVSVHFARRTHRDYVEEAFRKVSRGHRKLPPGGMLVFLTGQNEIKRLSKQLKQTFKPTQRGENVQGKVQISANDAPLEAEDMEFGGTEASNNADYEDYEGSDVEIRGLDNDYDEEEEDEEDFNLGEEAMDSSTKVHILPLYSQLPTKEQLKVFEPPPEGSRLIVLATNVAETSLTIPGIKYVFDCGRSKERQYDLNTGVQSFQVGWISKASADQRAGRSGRTGPGHCYRLYSSAVFEGAFAQYTDPEILRTPIEGIVLQMKSMGLHNIINFPFPTPPSREGLSKAEKLLKNLGALSSNGQVTPVGRCLSTYPLSPRFGKMLYIGHQHGCMPYVIALVAALAVGDLFVPENQINPTSSREDYDEDEGGDKEKEGKGQEKLYTNTDRLQDTAREQRSKDYARVQRLFSKHDDTSDALKFLSSICAYAYAPDGDAFCEEMFLHPKAYKEASQLRHQLTDIVRANNHSNKNPGLLPSNEPRLPEPSDKQIKALKQIVTAGFIDNVAIRSDCSPVPLEMHRSPKRAIDVPYFTLFRSHDGGGGGGDNAEKKVVYIHPSSILSKLSPKEMPQFLVYSHLQQSSSSTITSTSKIRMFPLVAPSGLQLSAIAHGTPLIEYGKPIGKVENLDGVPARRVCWVIPSLVGEAGSIGWPLPGRKVVQRKDLKDGWVIEKFLS